MIKLPCSINIQNLNWNEVKHHTNRTFEDVKTGTGQDDNLNHIETKFSKYNLSTDGKLYNGRFLYSNKLNNQRLREVEAKVNKAFADYVKVHNSSKSVQEHPTRAIKNLFKEKVLDKKPTKTDLKHDKNNKTKLDVYEKTFVQDVGNNNINNKIINIIKRKKHESYKKAQIQFLKASSLALYLNATTLNERHPNLIPFHAVTNVDEVISKEKGALEKSSSPHCHGSMLGFSYTKLNKDFKPTTKSKPSFSFNRALCFTEKVPYSRKRIKVSSNNRNGYKLVNQSMHKALKKFRIEEGKSQTRIFNEILKSKLNIDLHFKYIQTGQKHNGKSMEDERKYQQQKHILVNKQKAIKQARKARARQNYRNAINRRRNYQKDYKRHKRHLALINVKASSASAVINRANSLSASYSMSARSFINSALSTSKNPKEEVPEEPLNHDKLPVVTPKLLEQREHEEKINHQKIIEEANKNSLKNQYKQLRQDEKLEKENEAKIAKQKRQIKVNQIKIEWQKTTLGHLSNKFSAVMSHYKHSFKSLADNTIKSTKQALKQTKLQQQANGRATTSVANTTVNKAIKNLRAKINSEPNTFFGKLKANFYRNRIKTKSSEALQSLCDSVAQPIQAKHDSWVSLKDSLNINANNLYQDDYEKLTSMNNEKSPMTSAQFSNEILATTGLNLVQYSQSASISASASYSEAEPIRKSASASRAKSFSASYSQKEKVVNEKTKSIKSRQQSMAQMKERDNYFQNLAFNHKMQTDPKFRAKVNRIRKERNRGLQR